MNTFITSHFGYCPLVWMFCSRMLNKRINKIHKRALRLVYKDYQSSFQELLTKNQSFTIHEQNIQTLAIELYKVVNNISPEIMKFIFPLKNELRYSNENIFNTTNIRTVSWGTESLRHIGPKIWKIIPDNIKKLETLNLFKKEIRKWKPINCPCRLCKIFVSGVGFL